MKRTIFKKAFLVGGIFLLATLMSVQLSWGCDDHDNWYCHHHNYWECDQQCKPPKIQRVFLEYKPTPDPSDASEPFMRFSIWGKNFDQGAPPVVTLGGEFDLTVTSHSHDYILATLPMSVEEDFDYGDYRLVVSTCQDSKCKYCKDYCSKCKGKHCRDYCSKCKDRYCRSKYCKDDEHKCRCRDRYSLTIADPEGPSAKIGFKVESVTVESSARESFKQIEGRVECGSGFKVTGGGFSCPTTGDLTECRIMVSEPLLDDNKNGIGWRVIAAHIGAAVQLTIHAVCAQVE